MSFLVFKTLLEAKGLISHPFSYLRPQYDKLALRLFRWEDFVSALNYVGSLVVMLSGPLTTGAT